MAYNLANVICKRIGVTSSNLGWTLMTHHYRINITGLSAFHSSIVRASQEIKMPSLSPTMSEGTIVKWLKKEGDTVNAGDVLCEIQTDKAVMSLETEEEGILAKILAKDGSAEIKVGTVIAILAEEGEDWNTVSSISSGQDVSDSPEQSGTVPGTKLLMPSLSPTMTEGTLLKWHKKEGDKISPGDVLCDIQTDKAVMAFETEEEGVLAKILVPEGTAEVKIGRLIGLIVGEGEDWKNVQVPQEKTVPGKGAKKVSGEKSSQMNTPIGPGQWPAVRSLIELYHIDSSKVTASGKKNKLLKSDVLQYISDNKLMPKPPRIVPLPTSAKSNIPSNVDYQQRSPDMSVSSQRKGAIPKYVDIELSSMRRTIAKRLTESKTGIPHAYATADSTIDQLLALRKQLKSSGVAVSVNDFVIKAVALSLRECPFVNCLHSNNEVKSSNVVDVSVAVATESGLITPIIKSADEKRVDEISEEIKELANRARLGKLQLNEFQGGTFTISNLGMFGISEFSAIINPPQCGILAVGGGRAVVGMDGKAVTKMSATLSYDARAISESAAAEFLEILKLHLENPASLLLGAKQVSKSTVRM